MKVTHHYNLNRAFEIAMVANQSVIILVSKDEERNTVDFVLEKNQIEKSFSPHINFADATNFATSLGVELYNPQYREVFGRNRKGSSLEDFTTVIARSQEAKSFQVEPYLDTTCQLIIEKAYKRGLLDLSKHDALVQTATSIAKLEKSESIRVSHVAEAVQYFTWSYEEYTQTIEFGIRLLKKEVCRYNDLL